MVSKVPDKQVLQDLDANFKAGVAWYGRLDSPKDDLQPANPVDLVNELKSPVVGLYGGADSGIPNEHVAAMQEKLKAAGKPSELTPSRCYRQDSRGAQHPGRTRP